MYKKILEKIKLISRNKKKVISEKDLVQNEWYKEAKNQTLKTLPKFIDGLITNYKHDYGTLCHSVVAGMLATLESMNKYVGLSGYQVSTIGLMVLQNLNSGLKHNKTEFKIINYDDLLYPQYEEKFDKTISNETWLKLQEEAKRLLEENKCCVSVKKHWESIVNGEVPFGFKIEDTK